MKTYIYIGVKSMGKIPIEVDINPVYFDTYHRLRIYISDDVNGNQMFYSCPGMDIHKVKSFTNIKKSIRRKQKKLKMRIKK